MDVEDQDLERLAGGVGIVDPLLHVQPVLVVIQKDVHLVGRALVNRHGRRRGRGQRAGRGRGLDVVAPHIDRVAGQGHQGHDDQAQQQVGAQERSDPRRCPGCRDGRPPRGAGIALRLVVGGQNLFRVEVQELGIVAQEAAGVERTGKGIEGARFQGLQVGQGDAGRFGNLFYR
ncbi:MAG: hypothetical protein P8129_19885 [Anaerolineae bacterium]